MPDRKLVREITLGDGTTVATIGDAATLIEQRFHSTRKWGALESALALLAQAAKSGNRDDIAAATDALERILRHARLM